jgi:Arm DNA-binding domain
MFDARTAKLLAPGEHLTIEEAPGLRLEASQSAKAWIYRYRSPVDGRMRQIRIGRWPALGYQAAWVEWEKLRGMRDRGQDPAAEKRAGRHAELAAQDQARAEAKAAAYLVRHLCADYVGSLRLRRKAKGCNEVARIFDTMLGDLADLSPKQVTRAVAYAAIEAHAGIPVQAKRLRAELGAAWDYGIDSGKVPEDTPNWWRQILRGKLRTKGKTIQGKVAPLKRVLSGAELGQLVCWLPNFPRNNEDQLTLYLWTMCRGSEIVAMQAQEIRDEGAAGLWWQIPKAKTKNAHVEGATDLRVPLVGRAAEVVRRRLQAPGSRGHLFHSHTELGHVEQKSIGSAVWIRMPYSATRPEYIRPRLPVTHWAPHDLRRSCRTLVTAMGCPPDVGEALLGHVQPGIEGVYNLHAYDVERLAWLTKLSLRLEELAADSAGSQTR